MLRGCLLALGLYAAIAVGYFYWLDTVFERPGSYFGAGIVGFVVLCCLGALNNARTALKDWSLAASARHGLPLRDGSLVAVTGTIHPVARPLLAPFSGEECALCEYNLASQARLSGSEDQHNTGSDYTGFLMTPCVIRGRMEEVRLLGFPLLTGFPEVWCEGYAAAERARQFLTSTQFEDRSGLKLVTALSVFGEIWSDEDGAVEKNLRVGRADVESLFPPELNADIARAKQWAEHPDAVGIVEDEGEDEDDEDDEEEDDEEGLTARMPKLTETRVPVGAEVCAIGIYNEMRRGLLPVARGRNPNRLIRGTAEEVAQTSRRTLVRNLLGSLVMLVLVHAAVYGAMQAYLHRPKAKPRRAQVALCHVTGSGHEAGWKSPPSSARPFLPQIQARGASK